MCDTFDMDKLKLRMNVLRHDVECNMFHYPYLHVYKGTDITPFVMARHVCSDSTDTTHIGWLFNDSEESFKHSCTVIAEKYGVKDHLVESAIWLMNAYYFDGEGKQINIDSFEQTRNRYGIRDEETFEFMKSIYGRWHHNDMARLAQMLHA